MSNHHLFGRQTGGFDNSAFGAQSSFDFDELGDLGNDMAAFDTFPGEDVNFNLGNGVHGGDHTFDQHFFQGRSGSMMGANSFEPRSSVAQPQSVQSSIINKRRDHVRQQFGQITPPTENRSELSKTQQSQQTQSQSQSQQPPSQETGKLSNEQRARNAANTRHSRSKNAKKKSGENDSNSENEGTQKQGKNIILQREKNRVAAAKCRAKKKTANEQQEELANEYGTTNNYLTREIRDLKNQKSELQNFLLAHRPGVCECHGIHDYNFGQAQRLVLNARQHVPEPTTSPSLESVFSTQSPSSEVSGTGILNMPSRHPSFCDVKPRGMQGSTPAARDDQQMSQDFADFLQSSPGGRAGFS